MANSTEGEYYIILYLLPIATSAVSSSAGLLIELFIVAVNVNDWVKQRSLMPADQIITSLAISKIFFHIISLLEEIKLLFPALSVIPRELIAFSWTASEFSGIWLSTLLSIFFCFKISTFHSVFLLRLKTIVAQKIVYLIITGVSSSIVYSFLFTLAFTLAFSRNLTQDNISHYRFHIQILFYIDYALSILLLLMLLVSSFLLIISLAFHIRRMKSAGGVMTNNQTYHRTIKFTVFSFLACSFFSLFGIFLKLHLKHLDDLFWFTFIWSSLPALHSVSLIYGTTKLRKKFSSIVCCLYNRNKKMVEAITK